MDNHSLSIKIQGALTDSILEVQRFSDADKAYVDAVAEMMTIYFLHGKQYDDRWWTTEHPDRSAVWELDRKTRRLWAEIWCGKTSPSGADKIASNAADAANGALFLLALLLDGRDRSDAS